MARPGARPRSPFTGRLFWKFFLSILLAQLAAAAAIGSVFWLREQARLPGAAPGIETGLPAVFLIDSAAVSLKYGDLPALRELIGHMRRHSVYVVDEAGRDLLGRPVPPAMLAQARRELHAQHAFDPVRVLSSADGRHWLAFVPSRWRNAGAPVHAAAQGGAVPAPSVPPPPGPAFGGGRDGGGLLGPARDFGKPVWVLASVLVSLLFAFLLAWYFARPIRALRQAFEAAAAGDLAPRFAGRAAGGDELKDLGRDFDRMSGRLRALMDGQRRLLHDVSHELRSPLARLQAAIGLAHQRPDRIAASLARIERESVRMDKLVGELLTLSRLEASPELPKVELVDMQELVDGIAQDARSEAGSDGAAVVLEFVGAAPAQVRGVPDLLWRAVENVVRNAVKHGGAGKTVELKLRSEARAVCIDVLDRGLGILEEDLPSIFQPFFRSNPAINNVDGHGLGLAIAERVIRAHGGTITACNRDGGGLQVAITLPLAA